MKRIIKGHTMPLKPEACRCFMAVAPSSVSQQKSRIKKRLLQTEGFVFGEGETLDEWIGRF